MPILPINYDNLMTVYPIHAIIRFMVAKVLIIAGSDSGGGAGIQADIKSVSANGGYAATAITAVTAQNTQGVFGVHPVPIPILKQQIELVLSDIGVDAIKIGMLHSAEVIACVVEALKPYPNIPIILDPVMVAKGGHPLLEPDAVQVLKTKLFPLATIVTPNIPEAELLCGMKIETLADMQQAAKRMKAPAVLIKGGHREGDIVQDVWLAEGIEMIFESPRIHTRNTHGTGCTLASAIATNIAKKMPMNEAVFAAREYVHQAIATAPSIGKGHGPLNHFWPFFKS